MPEYRSYPTTDPRDVASARGELPPTPLAATGSGVSWGAIFAGAAGAAALSLVLLLLGTGLGLSSVSPWAQRGATATAVGLAGIGWVTFTQLAASGLGGYLAGRLRTKWAGVHTDEVYFRDTAHGFLAWCVATLLMASVLTSAVGSAIGAGAQAGAAVAGGAATAASGAAVAGAATAASSSAPGADAAGPLNYFVDSLFRRDAAAPPPNAPATTPATEASGAAEVGRIFARALGSGTLPPEDAKYVAGLVAQRTGMSPQDAEKRVNDTYAKARAALEDTKQKAQQAADAARRASAYAALWLVASLLVGAFVASVCATWGGRRRDL